MPIPDRPVDHLSGCPPVHVSGSPSRPPARSGARAALLTVLLAIGAPDLLGGCTTTTPSPEEQARRQAAIERWSRCVERRSEELATAFGTDAARRRDGANCEGHRRDVIKAFPTHMERRLERVLDERAVRRSRTHLRRRVRDLPPGVLVKRLFDALPPG